MDRRTNLPSYIAPVVLSGVIETMAAQANETKHCPLGLPERPVLPVHLKQEGITAGAYNHHHGMQAEARFDLAMFTGFNADYDGDGIERELPIGDITAVTIYQAVLGVPGRVRREAPFDMPRVPERAARAPVRTRCLELHPEWSRRRASTRRS